MSASTLGSAIVSGLDAAVGTLSEAVDINNRAAIAAALATAIFAEPTLVNANGTIAAGTSSLLGLVKISGTPTDAANPVVYVKEQADALLLLKADATSVYTKIASDAKYVTPQVSLAAYGILDAYTKTAADAKYLTIGGVLSGTTLSLSGQLTSSVAVGVAPFVVTSTTMVTNLNANMLGGQTLANLDARYSPISGGAYLTQTAADLRYLKLVGGALSGALTSTVTTGTAPFIIASTTLVTNLNANMLGGQTLANLDSRYIAVGGSAGSVTWGNVTGKPTTRDGYALTDVYTLTQNDARYDPLNGSILASRLTSATVTGAAILWQANAPQVFVSATTDASYTSAGVQLREAGQQSTGAAYGPRIAFHWGGVVASQIGMDSGGNICVLNNPGTSFSSFIASNITATGSLIANGPTYLQGQHLALNAGSGYTANLVFGASGVWDSGIRTYDNGCAEMRIWGMNANAKIVFATGYNGNMSTTLPADVDAIWIVGNRLGIGIQPSTSYKLHVNGSVYIQSGILTFSGSWFEDDGAYLNVKGSRPLYINGSIPVTYIYSPDIYLGSTSGGASVHLSTNVLYMGAANTGGIYSHDGVSYGTLRFTGAKNGYAGIYFDYANYTLMAGTTIAGFYQESTGTWMMQVTTGGVITANSYYTTSARALKEDIAPLSINGLALIEKLSVVQYRYKKRDSEQLRAGIIADDTDSWISGEKKSTFDLANGLGISFDAIQRLSRKNRELEARVAHLETRSSNCVAGLPA